MIQSGALNWVPSGKGGYKQTTANFLDAQVKSLKAQGIIHTNTKKTAIVTPKVSNAGKIALIIGAAAVVGVLVAKKKKRKRG